LTSHARQIVRTALEAPTISWQVPGPGPETLSAQSQAARAKYYALSATAFVLRLTPAALRTKDEALRATLFARSNECGLGVASTPSTNRAALSAKSSARRAKPPVLSARTAALGPQGSARPATAGTVAGPSQRAL